MNIIIYQIAMRMPNRSIAKDAIAVVNKFSQLSLPSTKFITFLQNINHIYIYIYIYIYTPVGDYVSLCIHIYIYIHTHAETHTHTYIYIYI